MFNFEILFDQPQQSTSAYLTSNKYYSGDFKLVSKGMLWLEETCKFNEKQYSLYT